MNSFWADGTVAEARVDAKRGDHFLQAAFPILIRTMPIWITSESPTIRELSSSVETYNARWDLLPTDDLVSFLVFREWQFAGESRGLGE